VRRRAGRDRREVSAISALTPPLSRGEREKVRRLRND